MKNNLFSRLRAIHAYNVQQKGMVAAKDAPKIIPPVSSIDDLSSSAPASIILKPAKAEILPKVTKLPDKLFHNSF